MSQHIPTLTGARPDTTLYTAYYKVLHMQLTLHHVRAQSAADGHLSSMLSWAIMSSGGPGCAAMAAASPGSG